MVWFSHWTLMIIWCNLFWVDTFSFVSNLPAELTVHGNRVCPQSWEVRVGNGRPTSCRVFIHWMIAWFVSNVHPLDNSKDLGFAIALLSLRIWGMGPLCGHSSYWWLDPIFTWYMVSLELQMDVKRTCVMMRLESICLIDIDIILGSIMNTLEKVYIIYQRVRESSLRPPLIVALQLQFWSLQWQSLWFITIANERRQCLSRSNGYDCLWSPKCSQ